ncbi:MAG: DUF975 family protein [Clostridia bacterium]|nr:DUF975 family protein [Clostridia bacterium]
MDRKQLKAQAKEQIKGKIGVLIAVTLVIGAITAAASFLANLIPGVGLAVSIIVTPAFALSTIRIYLMVVRGGTPEVKNCFDGFDDFFSAFKVTLLVGIYTFLWSLLFIIPGIVKGYSYSMAMYVLADNKGKSARECIAESKAMMEGHKMELFVLDLSFIGWYLLCSLTCGLAALYVVPLLNATHANVYETIKPVVAVPFEEVTEEVAEDIPADEQ